MYKHRRNDSFQNNTSTPNSFDPPDPQSFQPNIPMSARPLPPPSSARSSMQPGKARYGCLNSATPHNYGAQTARDNLSSPAYSPNPRVYYPGKRKEKIAVQHFYHTPIHHHPRAQSTFDQNPYQSETTKEPSHHSKSARDQHARYPLPLPQYNTSSYQSQLSSSEMMTELQFSLSTIEISGYDKLEEISCSMHNLKDSVSELKNLLNKPPKRPDQQHIEIPVSVWNQINQRALKTKQQAEHFETELETLIKDAWDDKDKLLTKKREFEKVLMKVNEERKKNKRKILVQQTEIDQKQREIELKQTDLYQGYEQLENLWEEQTKRIKSNIGEFEDTMDYQFHDDWSIFLKSLKQNADTDSKEFIQEVHANHALTCSGKINFSELNGGAPFKENPQMNHNKRGQGSSHRNDMLLVDELHIRPQGIKEEQIKALSGNKRNQRRKLSYISDRVPCHSREISNNGQFERERRHHRVSTEEERNESAIDSDQDTADVFNGPANGMELEPVWDPDLDDASSNRVESPSRMEVIEQFKGQCENSEMPSFLNQVLKIAKNKDEIVEAQKEKLEAKTEREPAPEEDKKEIKPKRAFLREKIKKTQELEEKEVYIGSGTKVKQMEESQSERISPMLASKLRHGLEQGSHSDSGDFDKSLAEVSGEQDPREWIKDEENGMMDMLKTATDECLVQRLQDIAINNGVQIDRIVKQREKELEEKKRIEEDDERNLSLTHPALNQSVQIILKDPSHQKHQPPPPEKSRMSSISSSVLQNPFEAQQSQEAQETKVKYSSRQPSLEMSEQQIQSTRGLASKHAPQISITSSQISDGKSITPVSQDFGMQEELKSRNNLHQKVQSGISQGNQVVSFYSEASLPKPTSENEEGTSDGESKVNSPGSPSIKVDLNEEPSEFIVKQKCLNPQMSLEVIQENQSEFSNSQSILDSVSRSEVARKARVAKRKANEHFSLQENKSILARQSQQLLSSQFAKSEIPDQFKQRMLRNHGPQIEKQNSSESLDDPPSLYQNESTNITNYGISPASSNQQFPYPPPIDNVNPENIDITIETPAKRVIPAFESPAQSQVRTRPPNIHLRSFVKNRQSAPASKRLQKPNNLLLKDVISKQQMDNQFSQKTPSARISFKRSSIKYKKLNKQLLAESFSEIQKNSQILFFPPNIKAKKQLEHDTSLSIQAHKILSNRKIANKIGSPSALKLPYSGSTEQSKAKKLLSRNLLESLSGKYSQNLSSGVAFCSNLVTSGKQNSSIFKKMTFSLVGDPKGNSGAQIAVAKRPFEDNNALFNHNESRLFEALQLEYPQHSPQQEKSSTSPHCCLSEEIAPIYSSYLREGPIDLNINRIGICFLSGEQNIQHFGEYSLVPQGLRRQSIHSTEESKETLQLKKRTKQEPVQRQMGRIIRLNSGLFVTAAIDMNSLKSDISSTESRHFYFGVAPFKFQSGIASQRVSQRKSPHIDRHFETLKREGVKGAKQQGTIGEIGSRITIKWN